MGMHGEVPAQEEATKHERVLESIDRLRAVADRLEVFVGRVCGEPTGNEPQKSASRPDLSQFLEEGGQFVDHETSRLIDLIDKLERALF